MIQCKHYDRGDCHGELCARGHKQPCGKYEPARKYKAFGWVVTVRFRNWPYTEDKMFHYCGCRETDARRKGMLKSNATEIIRVEAVETCEQWVFAFGNPEERGL